MKKLKLVRTTVAVAVLSGMVAAPSFAATIYNSTYTQSINGFMPIIPSVGAKLYEAGNPLPYKSADNAGTKGTVKVGDVVRVPTYLEEAAYDQFYSYNDMDKDPEYKKQINLNFEWYLLKEGATVIDANATRLTVSDGVSINPDEIGPTYVVGANALGKQIGFRIKANSKYGVPAEGIYLDVPNIAFLGGQEVGVDGEGNPDPSVPPITKPPVENPDIDNSPVAKGSDFIVEIKDLKTGNLVGGDQVYVNREYQAIVKKWDDATNSYATTNDYDQYITWNLYLTDAAGHTAKAEFMTAKGYMEVPTDPTALAAFDPANATFRNDASVTARFNGTDNTKFKTQVDNAGTIEALKTVAPNFSDQGLNMKVRLVLP